MQANPICRRENIFLAEIRCAFIARRISEKLLKPARKRNGFGG